ncbi:MAG: Clp protease N-terminal domain-containing protein [bacterium]
MVKKQEKQNCLGLYNQEVFIYWGKRIDQAQMAQDKARLFIENLINGFFILFGITGLLAVAWKFVGSDNWFDFYQARDWRLLLFWLSVVGDFFLVYRLDRKLTLKTEVQKKPFGETVSGAPRSMAWQDGRALTQKAKLDVSRTFSEESLRAINKAWQLAAQFGHQSAEPIHLLAGLFSFARMAVILGRLGVDAGQLKEKVNHALHRQATVGANPNLSPDLRQVLLLAYLEAYDNRAKKVDLPDLMVAIAGLEGLAGEILFDLAIDLDKVKNVAQWLRIQKTRRDDWQKFRQRARLKPTGGLNRAMTAVATPCLDAFGSDLTRLAKFGYLTPCLGREQEINAIYRLIEGGNRSAILVGDDRVGKTAILAGLAQRMVAEEVPPILRDKRLINLSIAKLVRGATPAEAEARLLAVIDEILRSGNIVLAIGNVQNMFGFKIGRKENLNLAGILASALAKKYFFCLATANPLNYRRHIESSALSSVLEKVEIAEMNINQAIQVLETRSGSVEYRNKVYFSYEAMAKIVELAGRYLPAKAIDVLEETAIYARKKKGERGLVTADDAMESVAVRVKKI